SLNFGRTVGDDDAQVERNQTRGLEALGRRSDSAFLVWQVHSSDYLRADRPSTSERPKADIVLTANPAVTLVMRFADCLPIFLYDPRQRAVALVHAGWQGTVRRAAEVAVQALTKEFGSRPQDLQAGIGPSIGPDHYPVGEDVVTQMERAFGSRAEQYLQRHNGEMRLDLWSANAELLKQAGVPSVEVSGICTVCHLEDWFSHRGEHGRTGRFGAILALGAAS
ncbi:MAG: peptidoglycan editing factor PgeF, partial [Anaerolineales bacterium]